MAIEPLSHALETLISRVNKELLSAEKTIKNILVTTYWNIGKYIKEHILENQDRAEHGEFVFAALSENTPLSLSNLYRSVQFYEEYPENFATLRKLSWSHFLCLLPIDDLEQRKKYEERIAEENISVKEFREILKYDKKKKQIVKPLKYERGVLWNYRYKEVRGLQLLDLGFHWYAAIPKDAEDKYTFNNNDTTNEPFYTYKAHLLEVVDGDTLWVYIDLGFGNWTDHKIRLRGINARELGSPEGDDAFEYLKNALSPCDFIVIKTYWRDKFARYLADVFYDAELKDEYEVAAKGRYLNQELLDEGLAVKL